MTWAQKFSEWLVEEKEENITTTDGKPIKVFSFNYNSTDDETMSDWAKHFRNHYCPDNKIDILRSGTGLSKKDNFQIKQSHLVQVSVRVILVRY